MKVIINISKLSSLALKRGVGFYTKNLCNSLKKLNDGNKYSLKKTAGHKKEKDLIHYPFFDPFFLTLPLIKTKPVIVTVHDLTPLNFPQHYPPGIKGKIKWQLQKFSLKQVKAIIADSKNSKKDIIKITDYPEKKIFVIPLAAEERYKKFENQNSKIKIRKKFQLPETFLLYVGDLNWNKNVKSLIQAFNKLKIKNEKQKTVTKKLKLIFVGKAFIDLKLKEAKETRMLIKKLKLTKDVLFLGFVSHKDLVAIYNLASLYVQPSFYEGFGLPVLEAMSCGCPVLSSNQASLPEVGGQAVEYFNPYNQKEFEKKLFNLINNRKKLIALSKKGLKRAKKFSWQKTAFKTREIYQKIIFGK